MHALGFFHFAVLFFLLKAPNTTHVHAATNLVFVTFNDSDLRLTSTTTYSSFKVKHDWWLVEHLDVEAFDTLENMNIYLRFAPSLDPSGMHSCYEFKTVAASASSIAKKDRNKMSAAAFLNTSSSSSQEEAQQEVEESGVKTTTTNKGGSVEEASSTAASTKSNSLLPETTMPALKSMLSQALAKSGTFCYPAVIVSGVMKCGTSALFELFQKYPGVNAQNGQIYIKENCAFFTSGLANRNLLQYFYSLPTHMNMGELHVGGCINTKSNELIEKILRRPKTFHIFLFRDFADWIWSAYNFWCSPSFERECDLSNYWAQLFIHSRSASYFHEYVSKATEGISVSIPLPFANPCEKAKTMYRGYWERVLQKFPLDSVLAISSNELEQQPQAAWARIAERLGLDVHHPHLSSFAAQRYNTQVGDKHGSTSLAEFKAGAYEISNFELLKPETRSILDQCWKDDCLWASRLTGYHFPACKSNNSDEQQSLLHAVPATTATSSLVNTSLSHQHHTTGVAQHSGFLRKNLKQCHDKFGDPLHHMHRHTHNNVHHFSLLSSGGNSGSGGSSSGGIGSGGGRFSRLPKVLLVCSSLEWIEKIHILLTYVTSHTHKHTSRGGEGVSAHFVPQNDSCVTSIDSNSFSASSSSSSSFSSTSTSPTSASAASTRHEPLVYTIENLYEVQGLHGGVWRRFAAKDDSVNSSGKGLFFDRIKFSCSNSSSSSSSSSSNTHPLVFSKVIYVATDPFEDIWSKYLGNLGYSAGLETKDFLSFDWSAWEEYAQQSLNLGVGDEMQRRKVTLETEALLKTLPQEDLLLFSVASLRSDENRLLILHKLLEFIGLPLGGIGSGGGGGGVGGALQGAALLAEKTTSLSAASASNAALKFECAYLVANTHRAIGTSAWGNLGGLEVRDGLSMLGKVYISPSLACSFERAYRGYALFLLPERSESMGGGWWPTTSECKRLSSNNFSLSEIQLEERSVGWKNMCKMRYGRRIFQEGNIKALKHPVGLLAYPSIEMLNVRTLLEHSTSIFSGSMTTDYSLLNIFRGENVCGMRVSVVQLNPNEPTIKQQRTGEGVLSLTNFGKKKCMKGLIRGFPRTMLLLRDPFVSIWEAYKKEIGLDATFGVVYKSVYETKKKKLEKEKQRLKIDSASSGAKPFSSVLAKKLGDFSNATASTIMTNINLHWQKFALKMAANYSIDDLISTKTVLKGLDMFFEPQNVLMISYEKLLFAQGAFFVSTLQNMTDFGGYRRLSKEKLECAHSFLSVFRATEELDAMHHLYSEPLSAVSSSSSSPPLPSPTLLLCQVRALLDAKIGTSRIKFPWIRLYHDEVTDALCAKRQTAIERK